MNCFLDNINATGGILISLSLILLFGFIVTRLTKLLKLPNVTGYILAGVLIGPYALNLIPAHIIKNMSFLSDIALSLIAFGVGRFLKKEVLAAAGKKVIIITLFESILAGALVTLFMGYILGVDWSFALLLGAIATATAPASTMMTIKQYNASGDFVNTLLQIVAFDDVVCLLVFSVITAIIKGDALGSSSAINVLLPLFYNFLAIAIGALSGFLLNMLLTPKRSSDNRIILTLAILLGISGICALLEVSPLLACMVFSMVYINITHDEALYDQVDYFTPPIFSGFFILSGLSLDLSALGALGIIGLGYFIIRIGGKYLGAYLGCIFVKSPVKTRNCLGLALIPQAGVAIGLAFVGQRILPHEIGDKLLTIILASSVLYELMGPVCAKIALIYSGSIKKEETTIINIKEEATII